MMSEASNRFSSVLEGSTSGINVNTTFTVPAGCYFRGNIAYNNIIGTGNASVGVSKSGITVAVLGPNANLAAGALSTQNVPVTLNEGTYTVASIQASSTSVGVSWHGICFKK